MSNIHVLLYYRYVYYHVKYEYYLNSKMFTKKQLELIDLLKEMSINEASEKLGIQRGAVDKRLYGIRNKIEDARRVTGIANNWMRQYKRLGKLLRRQKLEKEDTLDE